MIGTNDILHKRSSCDQVWNSDGANNWPIIIAPPSTSWITSIPWVEAIRNFSKLATSPWLRQAGNVLCFVIDGLTSRRASHRAVVHAVEPTARMCQSLFNMLELINSVLDQVTGDHVRMPVPCLTYEQEFIGKNQQFISTSVWGGIMLVYN